MAAKGRTERLQKAEQNGCKRPNRTVAVVRDLHVVAQANDAALLQFRDSNGVEADVILQMTDGRWGAIIDTRRTGPPSFLAVIVGIGRWAYRRPGGVYVVPLAGLGC